MFGQCISSTANPVIPIWKDSGGGRPASSSSPIKIGWALCCDFIPLKLVPCPILLIVPLLFKELRSKKTLVYWLSIPKQEPRELALKEMGLLGLTCVPGVAGWWNSTATQTFSVQGYREYRKQRKQDMQGGYVKSNFKLFLCSCYNPGSHSEAVSLLTEELASLPKSHSPLADDLRSIHRMEGWVGAWKGARVLTYHTIPYK